MYVKRNIITIVILALWVGLLVALYIMSPISELSVGALPPTADMVFSACFCVVGIAGSVIGYLISSKSLILMSAITSAMQIISIIMFILYIFFLEHQAGIAYFAEHDEAFMGFVRNVLAIAYTFANPFIAALHTLATALIYIVLSAVLPIISVILLKVKEKKKMNERTVYTVQAESKARK